MNRLLLVSLLWMLLPTLIAHAETLAAPNRYSSPRYGGFLSEVSPDYHIKPRLDLTKVPSEQRKKAFTFVFLMNKKKPVEADRKHMHVLWTGSKKIMKDQKEFDDKYPVDVSMAQFDDGYAPGEWNVVLPDNKPREVAVAFMWAF